MKSKVLKQSAKQQLRGKWLLFMFITFVLDIIMKTYYNLQTSEDYVIMFSVSILIDLLILLPLIYTVQTGLRWTYVDVYEEKEVTIASIFQPFKNGNFTRVVLTNLLTWVFLVLWYLLLFIPGIIKSYSYTLTDYIMRDYPKLSPKEVITKSRELMNGNKWKLLKLQLSFYPFYLFPLILILGSIGYFIYVFNQAMAITGTGMFDTFITFVNFVFYDTESEFLGSFFLAIILIIIAAVITAIYLFFVNLYIQPYYNMAKVNFYRFITGGDIENTEDNITPETSIVLEKE